MRTDRSVTRMSSDRVAMRPIVDKMTDACENITFPCGRSKDMNNLNEYIYPKTYANFESNYIFGVDTFVNQNISWLKHWANNVCLLAQPVIKLPFRSLPPEQNNNT